MSPATARRAAQRYADAAAEAGSALAAMEELAGQLGGGELSAPLQQMPVPHDALPNRL